MARRKEPGQREYNPLDDARGRLPIDQDLIRDVVSDRPQAPTPPQHDERPLLTVISGSQMAVALHPAEVESEPQRIEVGAGKGAIALEKLTAQNKFLTTPREKLELDRFAARVSGALGTSVKSSQIIR